MNKSAKILYNNKNMATQLREDIVFKVKRLAKITRNKSKE